MEKYNVWNEKYTGWDCCRLCAEEEKTAEFKDIAKETIKNETHRRKKTEKNWRASVSDGTPFRKPKIYIKFELRKGRGKQKKYLTKWLKFFIGYAISSTNIKQKKCEENYTKTL